jgi:hypothetical protein
LRGVFCALPLKESLTPPHSVQSKINSNELSWKPVEMSQQIKKKVSIVSRLLAGRPEFDSGQHRIFYFPHNIQTGSETHPVFYPVCAGVISAGVKRQGREDNHPAPSSAEIMR